MLSFIYQNYSHHKITVTKLETIFHFNKIAFHKNASTSVYIFQQKKRKMVFNINKLEIQLLVVINYFGVCVAIGLTFSFSDRSV